MTRAIAITWLLLLTSVTVALASDWGFVPPPEPAWGSPRCDLGSVFESATGTIHGAVICDSPLGPVILNKVVPWDELGPPCDKDCQRICLREYLRSTAPILAEQ
jgi:hypothetical protein